MRGTDQPGLPARVAAAVLGAVDDRTDEMAALASELVRIPSVGGSHAEHEAQAHLADLLAAGGLAVDRWTVPAAELADQADFPGAEVDRSEVHGVVGRLAGVGDGPTLLLDGHVDVVPVGDTAAWTVDPFAGERHDGRLWGRGAADMKGGLVAAHWAVQAVRAAGVRLAGDVLVAPVEGEEDGGSGTFALLQRGWRADACVLAEPTGLDLVPANAGALTFRLTLRGRATHAARRTEGVSAVDKLWPVWRALDHLEARRHEQVDPLARRWARAHPLSIGTVRAGDWASSVPDLLVAEGRMGVALDETPAQARRSLEAAVAEACASDPWLCDHPVEVEWWGGQFASARLPETSDLDARVAAAHVRATDGPSPEAYAAPYGSDLRLLVAAGVPTVQYGPGDAAVAHGPDEHVALADLRTAARTLALLCLDVCGVA